MVYKQEPALSDRAIQSAGANDERLARTETRLGTPEREHPRAWRADRGSWVTDLCGVPEIRQAIGYRYATDDVHAAVTIQKLRTVDESTNTKPSMTSYGVRCDAY